MCLQTHGGTFFYQTEKGLIHMNTTFSLRKTLRTDIESNFLSFSHFAQASKLRRSSLSLIFNTQTPMAIPFEQLIKITEALGHREDHFFSLYIDECFVEGKASRSRLMPFLNKCIELERQDCIADIMQRLDQKPQERHLQLIFDVCTNFLHTSKFNQTKELFNWLAANETNLSSERSSVIQYGLFRLFLSQDDNEKNLRTSIKFIPFLFELPEVLQLDALLQLTNVYFNLAKWNEMELYADQLRDLTKRLCLTNFSSNRYFTERHPVVYYGQGYLQKGNSLEHQGLYIESGLYISGYEDLSWFPNLGEIGWIEVQKFQHWAEANRFNLAILQGDTSVLKKYEKFLEQHTKEILPSLLTILESAERHQFSIDTLLEKFTPWITAGIEDNYYSELFNLNRIASLYSLIAQYHAKRGRHQLAEDFSSQALDLSQRLNNTQHFRVLASLSAARYLLSANNFYQTGGL